MRKHSDLFFSCLQWPLISKGAIRALHYAFFTLKQKLKLIALLQIKGKKMSNQKSTSELMHILSRNSSWVTSQSVFGQDHLTATQPWDLRNSFANNPCKVSTETHGGFIMRAHWNFSSNSGKKAVWCPQLFRPGLQWPRKLYEVYDTIEALNVRKEHWVVLLIFVLCIIC